MRCHTICLSLVATITLGCAWSVGKPDGDNASSSGPVPATAAPDEPIKVYFGNLHAHSQLSDGNPSIAPAEAYRIAREEGNLDFMSLSEHNHMLTPAEMGALISAADAASTAGFVALFGQEYSTIETGGNHTNIQNYPVAIPASLNGRYQQVFETLLPEFLLEEPTRIIFAEFNHPRFKIQSDYGLDSDFDGDVASFVASLDPFVQLIAVCNGPSDSDEKDNIPAQSERYLHREIGVSRWFDYLSHGMHLAPKIDHDTHSPTYGFRVAGRTAVWIAGDLTRPKLLTALASRHVYATEEPNLRIIPTLEGGRLPGDIVRPASEGTIALALDVQDTDEPHGHLRDRGLLGISGSGVDPIEVSSLRTTRTGNGAVSIQLPTEHDIKSFYVVHVTQRSSDPLSHCSADDAWLAPIWIDWSSDDVNDDDALASQFVGSKNSDVYHLPTCSIAGQIKPANLRHYVEAPSGKRLHQGCPWN